MAPIKCYFCVKPYPALNKIEDHLTHHTLEYPFPCKQKGCRASYRTKAGFRVHYSLKHPSIKLFRRNQNTKYLCYFCSNEFSSIHFLFLHLRVHTREFTFNCTFGKCKRAFSTNSSLKYHEPVCDYNPKCVYNYKKRNAKRMRQFACYFCSVGYYTKVMLYYHLKIHTMEVVKRCDGCKLNFTNLAKFKVHVQNCNKIITFPCKLCTTSKPSQGELNRHIRRVHTKDSVKTECYFCGNKLIMCDLTRHVRTHTKERPGKCQYCGVERKNSADLKKHVKKIHFPDLKSGKIFIYHQIITSENNKQEMSLKNKQKY